MIQLNERTLLVIANHLSSGSVGYRTTIDDQKIVIDRHKNGCRFLKYGSYVFMEQNKRKDSLAAAYARKGHKVVWQLNGDDNKRYPVCIVDNQVFVLPAKLPF